MEASSRRVIAVYVGLGGIFTLSASLIWAINTVFLLNEGGLSFFQAMAVNALFTVSQMVFEVPTGVVADTIGRKASMVISMIVLAIATLGYALTPSMGWGIGGFIVASALLGLGYTFQTGAVDAWLVDALDATGWKGERERVFAWGQIAGGTGMVVGSLLGGILGQIDLALPYFVRTGLLMVCFTVTLLFVRDQGFEPRPLRVSTFGKETRHIFDTGVRFGWRSPVVRPLLLISGVSGLFLMYGFYAWQPYVLALLGEDYVWLLGVVQAASSAAGILGNAFVGRLMRSGERRRDPARVLASATVVNAGLIAAIGAVGIVWQEAGVLPAAVAIVLWLGWGVVFGITTPVRMSFLNEHIPSSERATVLSLDAFFNDAGGAVGQPALGWLSDRASISVAWLVGAVMVGVAAPLYRRAGEAAQRATGAGPAE